MLRRARSMESTPARVCDSPRVAFRGRYAFNAQVWTVHRRSRRPRTGRDGLRRHAATVHQRRQSRQACGREPRRVAGRREHRSIRGTPGRGTPGSGAGPRTARSAASTAACRASASSTRRGDYSGFDVDFCRAVAAAVFGDPKAVEFRRDHRQRGPLLQTGEIDVLIRNTTWTSAATPAGACSRPRRSMTARESWSTTLPTRRRSRSSMARPSASSRAPRPS